MVMRTEMLVLIALSVVVLMCAQSCRAAEPAPAAAVVVEYEPTEFAPLELRPYQKQGFNLLPPGELERTPRDYLKVTATVKATGDCSVELVLVDILNREYRSPVVQPTAGQETPISIDMEQAGRPISMLRTVRLYAEGRPVEVLALRTYCAVEKLPEPEVTVQGPMDDSSIQAALNALGEDGGVVYIPAGEYVINNQVVIPADNITIYGEGRETIIQGTWPDAKGLFLAQNRTNLRFTRLKFRSLPITNFRGYSNERYVEKPEDIGKPSVTSRGIELHSCTNTRVDHCEVAFFGHAGIIHYGGSDNLVDHCFLDANFRYGLGYGVATPGTTKLYIEDNNFENHRHGIAGNAGGASYIARFNRLIKDAAVLEQWNQSPKCINQLRAHEIDAHAKCGWIYAHDNYVAMYDAVMGAGAMMRGNQGWLYRNVFVSCSPGIMCIGDSDDVWTWENTSDRPDTLYLNRASGTIHFDEKPPNFAEFPYPYDLNRLGWWPGAEEGSAHLVKAASQFAGPAEPQVLRMVDAQE